MNQDLISKTHTASAQWKNYFNQSNAAGCASMYEQDAQMVASPFGSFNGRQEIEGFWLNLVAQGFAQVEYIEPKIEVIDETQTLLSSGWKMNNAAGIITRELWVLQSDNTMRLREDHFEVTGSKV